MSKTDLPCLILCGGVSRRFEEGHKAMAQLGGKSVLHHVIGRVAPQCGDINLNAPNNVGFESYDLPLRPDGPGESKGPLAGILTAMEWAAQMGQDRVLTCSNDTPFIPIDWVVKLEGVSPDKIAVPVHEDRSHFVCALWPSRLQDALSAYLDNGGRTVQGFVQSQHIEKVEFIGENNVDPFFNINRSEDLRAAEQILQDINRQ
jgi:molybdopterin-guanine dinucleotide biosynthesis protein A